MSAGASHFRCSGCGSVLPLCEPRPFRCPEARSGDDIDHLLRRELDLNASSWPVSGDESSFLRFRRLLHSYHFARELGWSDKDYIGLVEAFDAELARVDGAGFRPTPLIEARKLALLPQELRLCFKDETQGVAGSHKARHLMGIALQLLVWQRARPEEPAPRLAIASCGNAALAAAVLARAAEWQLSAFVPTTAEPALIASLRELGARVQPCPRDPDSLGDPCLSAFEAAVAEGAVPFSVQGPHNGQCIEGGESLAWELASQSAALAAGGCDALFVQVGGGALASACVTGLREAEALGASKQRPRLYCVQTQAVHPLERAWRLAAERLSAALAAACGEPAPSVDGCEDAALAEWIAKRHQTAVMRDFLKGLGAQRSDYMRPWPEAASSLASGMLDDETYDWRLPLEEMLMTGGRPLIVSEEQLAQATSLAREELGVAASPTGAAGLAGLLELAAREEAHELRHAALLLTGKERA